jgi:hypothetical protein
MLRNTDYINLFIYYMDYPITINKPIKQTIKKDNSLYIINDSMMNNNNILKI